MFTADYKPDTIIAECLSVIMRQVILQCRLESQLVYVCMYDIYYVMLRKAISRLHHE